MIEEDWARDKEETQSRRGRGKPLSADDNPRMAKITRKLAAARGGSEKQRSSSPRSLFQLLFRTTHTVGVSSAWGKVTIERNETSGTTGIGRDGDENPPVLVGFPVESFSSTVETIDSRTAGRMRCMEKRNNNRRRRARYRMRKPWWELDRRTARLTKLQVAWPSSMDKLSTSRGRT